MARKIIELYQPIDKWEMSGELFARMLREADGSVVELRINSPGGDVGEGFSIANQIKQYSGKVVAVIEGYCASVATIIALACSEVHMHELSAWMMHRSSGGVARGNSEDMTSAAKALVAAADRDLRLGGNGESRGPHQQRRRQQACASVHHGRTP